MQNIKIDSVKDPYISRIITTSKGDKVAIPRILGAATSVKVLSDGKIEIVEKSPAILGGMIKKKILSEEQLVAKYGKYVGKLLQKLG